MTSQTLPRIEGGRPLPKWLWAIFIGTALLTVVSLTLEQPLVAVVIPLLSVGAFVLTRIPLKISASVLMMLVFFLEGQNVPFEHGWESPFLMMARIFLANLNAVVNIGALRLPLVDFLTLYLCAVAFIRRKDGNFVARVRGVKAMHYACAISLFALIGLDALGTLQGGNFNESLWQLRQTMMFPFRVLLLLWAFDGTDREIKNLFKGLIAVGVVKSLIGIWFVYTWIRPFGRQIEFTTSHSDTLLFAPLLALYFNMLIEKARASVFLEGLVWVPIVTYGMICNDRRLAYVCLGIAILITMLVAPMTPFKWRLMRTVAWVAPVIPPYVLIGWNSKSPIFFAAQLAKSVIVGDPDQGTQADYRDLENVNVLFSWSSNAIIPQGFGHKMQLLFPLPDISSAMPTWQYHPHNQFLWFMAIAGPIGVTLLLMPHLVTLYLAARTYRFTSEIWPRVFCLTAMGIIACFFNQMYGDMGTLQFTPSWIVAMAAAMVSKLAVRSGAWPKTPSIQSASRSTPV